MQPRSLFAWTVAILAVGASVGYLVYVNLPAGHSGTGKPGATSGPAQAKEDSQEPFMIFVGSSMQKPMERCVAAFEKETGLAIVPDYGDSGDVLAKVKLAKRGEAAVLHEPYIDQMRKEGFSAEARTLAYMTPVIAVKKGNPALPGLPSGVRGLKSFPALGKRVGLTLASDTPSGRLVQQALKNAGIQQEVMGQHPYENKSSGALVGILALPSSPVDAVCVWNAVAAGQPDKVDIVPIEPEFMPKAFTESAKDGGLTFHNGQVPVGLVVLKTDAHPNQTRRFVEFLLSPEGKAIWKSCGYDVDAVPPTP